MNLKKLVAILFLIAASSVHTYAGEVVIDGTDANEHGFAAEGANFEGWLYMQNVLERLAKRLTADCPACPVKVVVDLGTNGPSLARSAIDSAFNLSTLPKDGWTLIHVNGRDAIDAWLADLSTANTGILYIPTFALTEGDLSHEELDTINNHAEDIADFVKQASDRDKGGGLFSMGESDEGGSHEHESESQVEISQSDAGAYEWLKALIPGIVIADLGHGGLSSPIEPEIAGADVLTPETAAAIPWHNFFEGNLGGLDVLGTALDTTATRRSVILGGELVARADLAITSIVTSPIPVPAGSQITFTIVVTNNGPDRVAFARLVSNLSNTLTPNSLTTSFQLAPNASATLTVVARVNCSVADGPLVSIIATVTSNIIDPDLDNNSRTATGVVRTPPPIFTPASLSLGPLRAGRRAADNSQFIVFTVRNTRNAPLDLLNPTINRLNFPNGNSNDAATFSVSPVAFNAIPAGDTQTLTLTFSPVIPRIRKNNAPLTAAHVIPDVINSRLTFRDVCEQLLSVDITGNVTTEVKLIHPQKVHRRPKITLARQSDDEIIVTFFIHDSDMSIRTARFEFLRGDDTIEQTETVGNDLIRAIQSANLVRGQSFTVVQRFTGMKDHPDIKKVRLTVFDESSSDTSDAGTITASDVTASAQSLQDTEDGALVLTTVKLAPRLRDRASRGRKEK